MEHQRFGKGGENMKDLFEDMKKIKITVGLTANLDCQKKGKSV